MKDLMEAIEEMLKTLGLGSKRVERVLGGYHIKVYRINLVHATKKLVRIDILYEDRG